MPTYIYETIPESDTEEPERFELKQSMNDAALKTHPETGQPVRRVIVGGFKSVQKGKTTGDPRPRFSTGGGGCQPGCGCH